MTDPTTPVPDALDDEPMDLPAEDTPMPLPPPGEPPLGDDDPDGPSAPDVYVPTDQPIGVPIDPPFDSPRDAPLPL